MKILILNWWDIKNPRAGGAEVYLREVFSRIARKGHQVTLFCSRFPGSRPSEVIGGIKIIRSGPVWLINLNSLFFYFFNKSKFDLIIDYTNKIPYLTPIYVRSRPRLAIVLHLFRETWAFEWGFFGIFFSFLENSIFKLYKSTPIVAISQSTKEELIGLGINSPNIKISYPGVNFPVLRKTLKSKTPLVIYLGRLKKYKRVDFLLIALQEVIRKIPDLKSVIIGEGPDKKRLLKIQKKLNLEKKVSFLGFISESEKIKWLKSAWVNVQPSIKEGWGLSVIEAAACGTPTIAANVPGLRESVIDGKTGWLFSDTKQLQKLLIEVLTNQKMRIKAGFEARKFAQNFSWDKTARGVEKEIEKISSHFR